MQSILKGLPHEIRGLFQWGSRYYAEKMGVMVGFVVLSIACVAWAFSGPNDTNRLGAELYLRDVLTGVDLAVENTGRRAWTDVRIAVDYKYLFTAERLNGGESLVIGPDDLQYFYMIPRPWGREDWEELAPEPKPELNAPQDYVPAYVQVRSNQGLLDERLGPDDDEE